MSTNPEVRLTLDDAVAEVLGQLTGLDLTYKPELDRYRAITRQLNRALRANALETDWSWYATTLSIGSCGEGQSSVLLPANVRPRIINDDAVRLVDSDGNNVRWAYFLPRDALHKYQDQNTLHCSVTQNILEFSRGFWNSEAGLSIHVPIMREPIMFRLPSDTATTVPKRIREQPVDFDYPDVIIGRAAYYYAQSDPMMQPRVQTLEADYKDLMYQLIERDTNHTDSPSVNSTIVPVQNGLFPVAFHHRHPHAN